jgi:hypothetical protein
MIMTAFGSTFVSQGMGKSHCIEMRTVALLFERQRLPATHPY